jgi:hypothetical protein
MFHNPAGIHQLARDCRSVDANDVLQEKLDFRIAPSDEAQCPFALQKLDSVGTILATGLFLKLGLVWLTLAVARNEPDIHGKLARNYFDFSAEENRKRACSGCIFECGFQVFPVDRFEFALQIFGKGRVPLLRTKNRRARRVPGPPSSARRALRRPGTVPVKGVRQAHAIPRCGSSSYQHGFVAFFPCAYSACVPSTIG